MPRIVNPFRALGLDTKGLQGISKENIRALVHSQWRAMQRIFHPDKGQKNDRRSKEINGAYEEICRMLAEDDHCLQEFFGKNARRITEEKRERDMAFLQLMYQGSVSAVFEYFNALAADSKERLTVFNCAPSTLRMTDYALARYKEGQWHEPGKPRPFVDKEVFYVLSIDTSGNAMKKRTVGGSSSKAREVARAMTGRLVCGISGDTIKRHDSIAGMFAAVGHAPPMKPSREQRYLSFGDLPEANFSYAQIPLECIHRLVPLLTPYIDPGTMLFSFQQGKEFFCLEGVVTKIEKPF